MNKVILTGHLTRDIEVRYTTSNVAVGNFTIAVKKAFKNANGEYEADFINCVCFKEIAEKLGVYLSKGTQVLVEGRIQTRSYDAQDGSKRYVTEVISDKIELLGSKPKEHNATNDIQKDETVQNDPYEEMGEQVSMDDLPF